MNDEQIAVGLMKLGAIAGDGHTYLRPRFLTERGELGIHIIYYSFVEGVFVTTASTKYKDLLGAQVLRVGAHSVEEVSTFQRRCFRVTTRCGCRWKW